MKKIVCAFIFLAVALLCDGQQIFQDAGGKANIFLGGASNGWLTFNSSDKSGSIGYNRNRNDGYDFNKLKANLIYGGDVKIGIKNGTGSVVSDGSFKPAITLSGNIGLFADNLFKLAPTEPSPQRGTTIYGSFYLRPSFTFAQYAYVDTTLAGIPKMDKVSKKEAGILVNLNFQINKSRIVNGVSRDHYFFIGLQSGYTRTNNYNDLDDVTITTNSITAGNTTISKSETGKFGQYQKYDVIPLNFDFGVTPRMFKHNFFGFNTYFRSNFNKPKNDCKAGVGIYLADEKKPSSITGGFAWQFNDIFNALQKNNKSTFEKSSIFFYVGYTIK